MLCMRDERRHIELALVYFDVESQQENILKERAEAQVLLTWFAASSERFACGRPASRHTNRHAMPRCSFSPSLCETPCRQRMLAEAAYKAATWGNAF